MDILLSDQKEIDFLERLQESQHISKLGEYAKVEVGITTGSNPFFTVPLSTVQFYDLEKYAKPLVGRSVQVPSAIFTQKDWQKNRAMEARTHLLTFPKNGKLKRFYWSKRLCSLGRRTKDKRRLQM